MLVQALVHGSLQGHFNYFILNLQDGLNAQLELGAVDGSYPRLAARAIHKPKVNSGRDPLNLQYLPNTLQMEYVAAAYPDAGHGS